MFSVREGMSYVAVIFAFRCLDMLLETCFVLKIINSWLCWQGVLSNFKGKLCQKFFKILSTFEHLPQVFHIYFT